MKQAKCIVRNFLVRFWVPMKNQGSQFQSTWWLLMEGAGAGSLSEGSRDELLVEVVRGRPEPEAALISLSDASGRTSDDERADERAELWRVARRSFGVSSGVEGAWSAVLDAASSGVGGGSCCNSGTCAERFSHVASRLLFSASICLTENLSKSQILHFNHPSSSSKQEWQRENLNKNEI